MKLLLTALVIAGAVMAVRIRKRDLGSRSAPQSIVGKRRSPLPRIAAAAVVLLMLAGAGLYLYLEWRDATRVVVVRVIEAGGGREVSYQAYRGDVEGRTFTTIDGRLIRLAETERMELGEN